MTLKIHRYNEMKGAL